MGTPLADAVLVCPDGFFRLGDDEVPLLPGVEADLHPDDPLRDESVDPVGTFLPELNLVLDGCGHPPPESLEDFLVEEVSDMDVGDEVAVLLVDVVHITFFIFCQGMSRQK